MFLSSDVEPSNNFVLTMCRSAGLSQQSLFVVVLPPLLVCTLEINYNLFWHKRNPLCGAGQIVALGMLRRKEYCNGVPDWLPFHTFVVVFSQEVCSRNEMLGFALTRSMLGSDLCTDLHCNFPFKSNNAQC